VNASRVALIGRRLATRSPPVEVFDTEGKKVFTAQITMDVKLAS